jgi:hypothetical protein
VTIASEEPQNKNKIREFAMYLTAVAIFQCREIPLKFS